MACIGIDCGATKVEFLLAKSKNFQDLAQPIKRYRIPTQKDDPYDQFLGRLLTEVKALQKLAAVDYVGIGIAGVEDGETATMKKSSVHAVVGQTFSKDLSDQLGLEVKLENDAQCFALAEANLGAGKDYANVLGIILGTGVAGGLVFNKKLFSGHHGSAGEFGHWVINPLGPKCYCGNKGCIETLISGKALERIYSERSQAVKSVPEIYQLYQSNDPLAREVFDLYLDYFAFSLSTLINIFDPEAIVLGGGVSNLELLYQAPTKQLLQKYVFSDFVETLVLPNKLGDSSGIYGACLL